MFAIESENIVGYQQIEIPAGWSIYTTTFKNVSGDSVDLNSVAFLNASRQPYATTGKTNTMKGKIQIQKISADGSYASSYAYFSTIAGTDGKAWSQDGNTAIADGVVTFADGEAFAVNNLTSASVYMQLSGEVELTPKNVVPAGWSLMGNSTPVDIDLTQISFLNADGLPYATSGKTNVMKGKIQIQKINADGSYATSYAYFSTIAGTDGKAWSQDGNTAIAEGIVTLKAGEAFAINNLTSGNVTMVLPSPVQ